jgi:hypothetical protein
LIMEIDTKKYMLIKLKGMHIFSFGINQVPKAVKDIY